MFPAWLVILVIGFLLALIYAIFDKKVQMHYNKPRKELLDNSFSELNKINDILSVHLKKEDKYKNEK